MAGVPASYVFGYVVAGIVVVGVMAGAGRSILGFWRDLTQGEKDQDAEIAKLRLDADRMLALLYGRDSGVPGAVGPGIAGYVMGKDYGGEGGGLVGEASGRAEDFAEMMRLLREMNGRTGGGDAAG